MGVVQEPVADRVGQGRIGQVVMPLVGRQLAGDDGRAGAVAILEDLEQIAALGVLDGREPPVVDDEDIDAGQLGEQADVGAVGPGQGAGVEESGEAPVLGAVAPAPWSGGPPVHDPDLRAHALGVHVHRSGRSASSDLAVHLGPV